MISENRYILVDKFIILYMKASQRVFLIQNRAFKNKTYQYEKDKKS